MTAWVAISFLLAVLVGGAKSSDYKIDEESFYRNLHAICKSMELNDERITRLNLNEITYVGSPTVPITPERETTSCNFVNYKMGEEKIENVKEGRKACEKIGGYFAYPRFTYEANFLTAFAKEHGVKEYIVDGERNNKHKYQWKNSDGINLTPVFAPIWKPDPDYDWDCKESVTKNPGPRPEPTTPPPETDPPRPLPSLPPPWTDPITTVPPPRPPPPPPNDRNNGWRNRGSNSDKSDGSRNSGTDNGGGSSDNGSSGSDRGRNSGDNRSDSSYEGNRSRGSDGSGRSGGSSKRQRRQRRRRRRRVADDTKRPKNCVGLSAETNGAYIASCDKVENFENYICVIPIETPEKENDSQE